MLTRTSSPQTALALTLQYATEFVTEFFDQNPISQLGIIVTRDGGAERVCALSGNVGDIMRVLGKGKLEARGEPSLMNVLELARGGLACVRWHIGMYWC